jgi:hypothetical protein
MMGGIRRHGHRSGPVVPAQKMGAAGGIGLEQRPGSGEEFFQHQQTRLG